VVLLGRLRQWLQESPAGQWLPLHRENPVVLWVLLLQVIPEGLLHRENPVVLWVL